MAANGLQDLYQSLQLTASNAQQKLNAQQTNRLRSIINLDQEGQPEFISWQCQLPAGDGGVRTHEMLRLPLASLYPTEGMEITELSLEFGCKIKEQKQRKKEPKTQYKITTISHVPDNNKNHTFKLIAQETNDYVPQSTIDGMPTCDYLEHVSQQNLKNKKRHLLGNRMSRRIFLLFFLMMADLALIFFSSH